MMMVGDSDVVKTSLYACMQEFRRTLEIITRTLREVVNSFEFALTMLGCLVAWLLGCGNSVALWRSSLALYVKW